MRLRHPKRARSGTSVRPDGIQSAASTVQTKGGPCRPQDRSRRPVTVWVLLALLVIQGLGGLGGGLSLTLAPDGSIMEIGRRRSSTARRSPTSSSRGSS